MEVPVELKPSRDKSQYRPRLDGVGNRLSEGEYKNPWATLARGLRPAGAKRHRPMADTLGATPPRDGPWSLPAADVAIAKPPKARSRRAAGPGLPFMWRR